MTFFDELNSDTHSGVAYKNRALKRAMVGYFAVADKGTISELVRELNISAPKVNAILAELAEDGIVRDYGKVESSGGRKPALYGLIPESGYFLGVDVKHNHLNLGLTNLRNTVVKLNRHIPYRLANNIESLEDICRLIDEFIGETGIEREKILGLALNLSGRINYTTGYSYSFFHFNEEPLSKFIEARLGMHVVIDNDSRAMAYGEFTGGVVQNETDVLFLNLDYGVGMGIMIDSKLYYGKSGFAGEVGHIPMFNNEILCHCGKKGCLETEASGWALVRLFKDRLRSGSTSIAASKGIDNIQLEDIITAAQNDDVLAIELIAHIGEKLGRGIAMLINVFNPQLVIMGGVLSATGEYIRLPIKSAINKYSLSLVNNDTVLKPSVLGEDAGIIGACRLIRKQVLGLST